MIRRIYYLMGPSARRVVRRLYYLPADLLSAFRREQLVPAKGFNFTGAGDFISIGEKFVDLAKTETGLSPSGKVLDIGCGLGRIARPLTNFLDSDGGYYGFDVVASGIEWCKKKYGGFKNFCFAYLPVRNDLYNKEKLDAGKLVFPYESNTFDLAFSISVFTHMQPDAVSRYLKETSRVLKKGKYLIATFFVIYNDPAVENTPEYDKKFPFAHDGYYLHHRKVKDANVAYDIKALMRLIEQAGLQIVANYRGWWSNETHRQQNFDYQDVFILKVADAAKG